MATEIVWQPHVVALTEIVRGLPLRHNMARGGAGGDPRLCGADALLALGVARPGRVQAHPAVGRRGAAFRGGGAGAHGVTVHAAAPGGGPGGPDARVLKHMASQVCLGDAAPAELDTRLGTPGRWPAACLTTSRHTTTERFTAVDPAEDWEGMTENVTYKWSGVKRTIGVLQAKEPQNARNIGASDAVLRCRRSGAAKGHRAVELSTFYS